VNLLSIPSTQLPYLWFRLFFSFRISIPIEFSSLFTSCISADRYLTRVYQVRRDRETKSTNLVSGTPWETITLTTLSSARALFPSLLADARDLAQKENEGKLVIHTAWGIEWRPFGLPRRKRPLGSVVLDEGVMDKIVNDVRGFLGRRTWYADRGWPFLNILLRSLSLIDYSPRYTVSQRLPSPWTSRLWKIIVYTSSGWFTKL